MHEGQFQFLQLHAMMNVAHHFLPMMKRVYIYLHIRGKAHRLHHQQLR